MSGSPVTLNPANTSMPVLNDQELKTLVPEVQTWDDKRAAAIAIGDFRKAEVYRSQNHEQRYRVADELYLGWRATKTWEGTRIPRSALAVHLVFEQVEALQPSIIGASFPDEGNLPFEAEAEPGTTTEEAKAVRDLLFSQLRNVGYRKVLSLREVAMQHTKGYMLYGNGVTEFGWDRRNVSRNVWQKQAIPRRAVVNHPVFGPVPVPTGQIDYRITKAMQEIPISKPCLQNTDIRDFYWDPNCNSWDIQCAGYCAVRSLPTINDLQELSKIEGFRIPSPGILLELAHQKNSTQGDQSKSVQESYRGMNYQPIRDQSIDPNLARVELIRYWQKNRHVWIIRNYPDPLYNQPNEYGVLPFLTTPYVDVPNRWAGISLPDLCETDQRLVETILNARVDELALMIHPPIIKKRGIPLPLSQQRIRPGLLWESDDPKNDYVRMEMGNVTAQAFIEVDAASTRTQRKTGVTDLGVLGTGTPGGNSANRTAAGVQAQNAGAGKRIQHQVGNLEDRFFVPLLNAFHAMNQKFLNPEDIVNIIGQEGQLIQVDPVDILNASVRFTMYGAGRMRQKVSLQSGGLALMLQTVMNPELLMVGQQMGLLPDFQQLVDLLTDTLDIPRKSLFIQGTPQQLQGMQQQQMAQAMLKMQMQNQRIQGQASHQDQKDETAILLKIIDKLMTPQAAHLLLNDVTGAGLDTRTGNEPDANAGTSQGT